MIWNPYKDNQGLSKEEFITLAKLSAYAIIVCDGEWITAYQPGIKMHEHLVMSNLLAETRANGLTIPVAILEDEIEKISAYKIIELRK